MTRIDVPVDEKTIRKLKKHDYECPKCEYSWTPKKICRGGCRNTCHCPDD